MRPDERWAQVRDTPTIRELRSFVARRALTLRANGTRRYSSRRVCEEARWEWARLHGTRLHFANAHMAYLARELVESYPELDGFFTFGNLRAGRWPPGADSGKQPGFWDDDTR
jgi:hypothetical protein